MKLITIHVVICCWICSYVESNYTFTFSAASRCKEHLCQHGYRYETYYKVESEDRRVVKKDPTVAFEMHLAILASSNGHILLSSVPQPEPTDPVYEIVVGGGGNKFTELRRNLRRNARTSAKTIGVLSPIEFRAFYIRISEDGLIEFGKEGEMMPILSYYDVNPLEIKFFSFAAWNGVEAKFLYDCPAPGDYENASPPTESQAVEPKLSNSDKLKAILLRDRPPNLAPGSSVSVKLGVNINTVKYDAFEAKLSTGLAIVASWTDDSMAWNPAKFNGTTHLTFRQGQIWKPTFFVFNSDDIGEMTTRNTELISMVNSGEATLHMETKLNTWCFDYSTSLNKWPHDDYQCSIVFGPWETHETITMEKMSANDDKMKIFTDIDELVQNEWDVEATQMVVKPSMWNQIFKQNDNDTYQSHRYVITLSLKRRATSYNIAFYTPLLVLVTFVLISFWTEPLKMTRLWFYAGSAVIICMGLCCIDFLVPCHTIPSILVLYTSVLIGVLLALVLHALQMTCTAKRVCKTAGVQSILTARVFRTLFCLPPIKTCRHYESINEGYATQEDDDSGVVVAPRPENVEEMQTDDTRCGESEELAEAIDKLMFVIYSVAFAVMLACHF